MSIEGFTNRIAPDGLAVLRAEDVRVCHGAALGEPMATFDALIPDDTYTVSASARSWSLTLLPDAGGRFRIGPDSQIGRAGAAVHLDCCAVLMGGDGITAEILVLVELGASGHIAATYLLPAAPLAVHEEYRLIDIRGDDLSVRIAERRCAAFARGTQLAAADGAQVPVERLAAGDRLLTRDHGAQTIRWIGSRTTRATGTLAPVAFAPGAVSNARRLLLSPGQRLYFYQREDRARTGRAEVIVRAADLVNERSIVRDAGGYVDYFHILLDVPAFVFAEGVATATLNADPGARALLPDELRAVMAENPCDGMAPATGLDPRIAADVLRGASTG